MVRLVKVINGARKALHVDLMEACETGNTNMAKKALFTGQSIHTRNRFSETPLHIAAAAGHADIVARLIKSSQMTQEALMAEDHTGRTPLFMATLNNRPKVVELILSNTQDIKTSLERSPWTGPHASITPVSLLQRRNILALVEKSQKIKKERDAKARKEEKKRKQAEAKALKEKEIARRKAMAKFQAICEDLANQDKNALDQGMTKWKTFIDNIKFGIYEELIEMDLDDLDKGDLRKHLVARGVNLEDQTRASHAILKKLLQNSIFEEADRRKVERERQMIESGEDIAELTKIEIRPGTPKLTPEQIAAKEKKIQEIRQQKQGAKKIRLAEAARRRKRNEKRFKSGHDRKSRNAARDMLMGAKVVPTDSEESSTVTGTTFSTIPSKDVVDLQVASQSTEEPPAGVFTDHVFDGDSLDDTKTLDTRTLKSSLDGGEDIILENVSEPGSDHDDDSLEDTLDMSKGETLDLSKGEGPETDDATLSMYAEDVEQDVRAENPEPDEANQSAVPVKKGAKAGKKKWGFSFGKGQKGGAEGSETGEATAYARDLESHGAAAESGEPGDAEEKARTEDHEPDQANDSGVSAKKGAKGAKKKGGFFGR